MEDNNHATQQRLNATIARLLAKSKQDDAASQHSTPDRSSFGSAEEVERLKKELDSERQKAADLLAQVLQNNIAGSDSDKKPQDALSKTLNKALSERILQVGALNQALRSLSFARARALSPSLSPSLLSLSLPPSLLPPSLSPFLPLSSIPSSAGSAKMSKR
jgi:hypothetical protein